MPTRTLVTGLVTNAAGNIATSGTVQFQIQPNASSTLYRVSGTSILAPNSVIATINAAGEIKAENGTDPLDLWGNDTISPPNTWYKAKFFPDGIATQTVDLLLISGTSYDLSAPVFYNPIQLVIDQAPPTFQAIQSNIVPAANGQYSLGTGTQYYASAYIQQLFSSFVTATNVQELPVQAFGVEGGGIIDESEKWALAILYCAAIGAKLRVPGVKGGYRCDTPWNLSNIDRLTIEGDGMTPIAFGWAVTAPTFGSVIFSHAGTGKCFVDATGANGVVLRGLTFCSVGLSTPANIGIILGTSTRVTTGAPGGAGCTLDEVAIMLPNQGSSVPLYFYNANLNVLKNVWCLGDYGLVMVTANALSVVPPYGVFGTGGSAQIDSDGNTVVGLKLLSYGGVPPLYAVRANDFRGDIYIANINEGPSFAGEAYPFYGKDIVDWQVFLECDFFPSVFYQDGFWNNINLRGVAFPGTTVLGVNLPIIGTFMGTLVDQCEFKISPIRGAVTHSNYHYTSVGGGSPTIQHVANSNFIYDSAVSTNVAFWNATADESVPFFSNQLNGPNEVALAINNSFEVNGSSPGTAIYRILLNSKLIGTG